MAIEAKQPAEEQENPYLPPGPPPTVFTGFEKGINTNSLRPGIEDNELAWCDGFYPLAKNTLRTLYGPGPALYTAPAGKTIVWYDFANISTTPFAYVLLSDGSIVVVATLTGASVQIAPPGTITNVSASAIGLTQWGNQYVIIVAGQPNGYFVHNGGATLFLPGQTITGTAFVVPTGVSGTTVETFTGRVWVSSGAVTVFSAPGSFVDFSTSDGGGSFTSTDSFLRVFIARLKQTNGFLYLIGDSSINYISGVQTSGSPPTTTFTNLNADPEVGTPYANSVQVFSRNILFANPFGAHVSYGGAVTKVSDALDGVFTSVPGFGGTAPSSAKAIIFGKHVWMVLVPIIDPVTGQQENELLLWDEKKWFASGQGLALTYIAAQEVNSVLTAYGTNGSSIFPLFQTPSSTLLKTVQSKLWASPGEVMMLKAAVRLFGTAVYFSATNPNLTVSIDNESGSSPVTVAIGPGVMNWTNNLGQPMNWTNNLGQTMTWLVSGVGASVFPPTAVAQNGALLGMTLQTQAADMALVEMIMLPEIAGYRG